MSTKDQILSSALYGEALLTARRPELQPLIDHLREFAQGRDDIRTECAGVIAGSWFAGNGKRGEDLTAAGLLMLAVSGKSDQEPHRRVDRAWQQAGRCLDEVDVHRFMFDAVYIHHLAQVFRQRPGELNAGGPGPDDDIIQVWPAFILDLIVYDEAPAVSIAWHDAGVSLALGGRTFTRGRACVIS
jgi:hypothetical protein